MLIGIGKDLRRFTFVLIVVLLVAVYFPSRHARRYNCIDIAEVSQSLYFQTKKPFNANLKDCDYNLTNLHWRNIDIISKTNKYVSVLSGGEYKPQGCYPRLKTAIIVPYRERLEQKKIFLDYMHHFLQQQGIHYKIFIVEQNNNELFNRAKLLNIGSIVAMKQNFPCLILHDIDLLPMNYANLYACSKLPRHMSSSLDTFRYNLPYLTIFGGAVSILSKQYEQINGMSNLFQGWGGEDDDLYKRLKSHHLEPCRFCPSISKYKMLVHKKNKQVSNERYNLLTNAEDRNYIDGLNSLDGNYTVELKVLYTHISVK